MTPPTECFEPGSYHAHGHARAGFAALPAGRADLAPRSALEGANALIEFLARRHSLDVLWLLHEESPLRFRAIKRALRASPVTLSARLDVLERAALIERHDFMETPPRVEYRLTEQGAAIVRVIMPLVGWAAERKGPYASITGPEEASGARHVEHARL